MALLFSALVAVLGVFVSQNAVTAQQIQLPYDPTVYRQLFSGAPYYSFCDLPWLTFFDQSYFLQFNELANQFNIRVSDLYQLHSIIESNMPNLPNQNEYNILYTAATELKKEMDRRGIYYLPTPPACYPLNQSPVSPASPLPSTYQPVPTLMKRSPYVIPSEVYPDPTPYTIPSEVYPDPTPFAIPSELYPDPTPYDPYTPYSINSDYAYELAYKNLYVMLDQYMPNLPSSTYNNIKNSVILNTPPQYQSQIDDVTNQLTTNMRYLLGMAQQRIPPLY